MQRGQADRGREVLGLAGERAWRVPSLSFPDLQSLPPLGKLAHFEAVQLFADRAMTALPDFRVTDQNAPAVAIVCHRLDGLPLAIELAAVRVKLFSAEALLAQLSNRLKLLVGGVRDLPARQATLRK